MREFALGINYWPISSAMGGWKRFSAQEVERDFARIRGAGLGIVRLFLLWEDFQPAPDRVSSKALEDLQTTAEIAKAHGLQLLVTLFTGHMSGANWLPAWALSPVPDRGAAQSQRFPVISRERVVPAVPRNWYADEAIQRAQEALAERVGEALGDHPAVWAWDLGNENSNVCVPPSREAGLRWLERMAKALRRGGARQPITLGLHMEDLEEDRRLGPAEAARVCDFLSMHGYPVYAPWADGPKDPWVLPFLGVITRWLGRGKPVLFEEFGAPTQPPFSLHVGDSPVPLLPEEEAASFVEQALPLLRRFGMQGALLWCYGDYDPALQQKPPFDRAPHELHFGLWRADGSEKPAVDAVRRFAQALSRNGELEEAPDTDTSWIDIPPERFYTDPRAHLVRLYRRFRERFSSWS